ncbi:immunoglobulin-like domain-containing protein [Agaribacterium sp. ZY112]|uniref:immunoglobulin-like domain-containing protein n=1 Tax=Agaribacterium sp. ZY112 TaxID=3233574 RepID=UPI0035250ABD
MLFAHTTQLKRLSLAASISLLLSACGGGGGGSSSPDSSPNPESRVSPSPAPVDTSIPVLELLSTDAIELTAGTVSDSDIAQYMDSNGVVRVSDTDANGNAVDLSANISVINTDDLDFDVPGSYTLTYTVSDSSGNIAVPVTREVKVLPAPATGASLMGSHSGLDFTWTAGTGADTYRLYRKLDGETEYSLVDGHAAISATSLSLAAEDLSEAQFAAGYQIEACAVNNSLCAEPTTVTTEYNLNLIGSVTGLDGQLTLIDANTEQTSIVNTNGDLTTDINLAYGETASLKIHRQPDDQICDLDGSTATNEGDIELLSPNTLKQRFNLMCITVDRTIRISTDAEGIATDTHALYTFPTERHTSYNGRWNLISTKATNFADNPTGVNQLYRKDIITNELKLLTQVDNNALSEDAIEGNLTSDGKKVFFRSKAAELCASCASADVEGAFMAGIEARSLTPLNYDENNELQYHTGLSLTVSGNGHFVLLDGFIGENGVYARDLVNNTTTELIAPSCGNANDNRFSQNTSHNGRYLTFQTVCDQYESSPNGLTDQLIYDTQNQEMTVVENASDARIRTGAMFNNGIIYYNALNDIGDGDTNTRTDVYRYNPATKQVSQVDITRNNEQTDNNAFTESSSLDGRYVLMRSDATNIVEGVTTDDRVESYIIDTQNNTITLLDISPGRLEASKINITGDGRYIQFISYMWDIVEGDNRSDGIIADAFITPNPLFTYDD